MIRNIIPPRFRVIIVLEAQSHGDRQDVVTPRSSAWNLDELDGYTNVQEAFTLYAAVLTRETEVP